MPFNGISNLVVDEAVNQVAFEYSLPSAVTTLANTASAAQTSGSGPGYLSYANTLTAANELIIGGLDIYSTTGASTIFAPIIPIYIPASVSFSAASGTGVSFYKLS